MKSEKWKVKSEMQMAGREGIMYFYYADGIPDIILYDDDGRTMEDQRIRWHPSIHMPREAARIFLRVTNVRCERLQNISNKDAKAEGVTCATDNSGLMHRHKFIQLWDSITPPECQWNANPWVWAITFERCTDYEAHL